MNTARPFILIAALPRTGSTVLSEALTHPPDCYILVEPCLNSNRYSINDASAEFFAQRGIHLQRYRRLFKLGRHFGVHTMWWFRNLLAPRLLKVTEQVGVKEINNQGWQHYVRSFENIRVILTARDPRDIYISLHYFVAGGKGKMVGMQDPASLAERIGELFSYQEELFKAVETLKVRYEDLCTDPTMLPKIKRYVHSDAPDKVTVGQFNAANPRRRDEFELHGEQLSNRRIERWRSEPDADVVAKAHRFMELLPRFCEFWGYPLPQRSAAGGQAG